MKQINTVARWFASGLVAVTASCGEESGPEAPPTTSYLLTFSAAFESDEAGDQTVSQSLEQTIHLDVSGGLAVEALASTAGSGGYRCSVAEIAGEVEFACHLPICVPRADSGTRFDYWTVIRVPVQDDGGLGDRFDAVGEVLVFGSERSGVVLEGTGTVAPDLVGPALSVARDPTRPAGLLPWDPVTIVSTEVLVDDEFRSSVSLVRSDGLAVRAGWAPTEFGFGCSGWDGTDGASVRQGLARQFAGLTREWDLVSGQEVVVTSTGATDRGGNVGLSFGESVRFLDVSRPDALPRVDGWEPLPALYGPGTVGRDDPRCESGDCVLIGPVVRQDCHAGLAVRRSRPEAARRVVIRFRAETATNADPGEAPSERPFDVELALPGDPLLGGDWVTATYEPGDNVDLPWDSGWTTATVPLPDAPSSEVGVLISADVACADDPADFHRIDVPPRFVRIESISVE